jgi:hypothetical protein
MPKEKKRGPFKIIEVKNNNGYHGNMIAVVV